MEPNKHHQLVIIGGGPAGFAAALYGARADLKPVIFSGMLLYGQASQTDLIENYPGFPEGIQGVELGRLFEQQASRFGAQIEYDQVLSLDFQDRPFTIQTYSGNISADSVILAMGADPKKLHIPGRQSSLAGAFRIAGPATASLRATKTFISLAEATQLWRKPFF